MPRKYQQEAIIKINQSLNAGINPIYCAPCRTGKTKTTAFVIESRKQMKETFFILVPSFEIFDQWCLEFSHSGIDYGYINADGVTGKNKRVYVCMPMSLNNMLSVLPEKFRPDIIITDECFKKGTRILTDKGYKKIEKIKLGDLVYTQNEKSLILNYELKPVLKNIKKEQKENIIKIKLSNKQTIYCTENHKIFTTSGWKKAKDIQKSVDMVQFIDYNFIKYLNYNYKCGEKNELYCLRKRNFKTNKVTKRQIPLLWSLLLFAGVLKEILCRDIKTKHDCDKQEIRKRKNEKKQSDVKSRDERKSQPDIKKNRTQTKNTRWERETKDRSSNFVIKKIKLGYGICCKNFTEKKQRFSKSLQIRHCKSVIKNWNRSRWKFTLCFKKKRTGYKKGNIFEWVRVENCSIQKQRGFRKLGFMRRKNYVYDLSVKDNHNYFANGILVHNCHHSEANTWQNIYNFYPHAKRLGLTATPQRTDGKGLDNTYDTIIETIDIDTAIKDGYLTKPVLIVPEKYKIEMDVPIIDGDYDINKQAELLGKTQIIGDVISQYGNIFNGAPVLVACCTIEHAEKMTAEFNNAGWKFETISSQIPYSERKRMLRQIRNGELNGLCTVAIGIEGLTIEGLYGLIWLRRTMSLTVYIQFSSRPLTPMKGKKYGIILDPVGNCFIHGKVELHRAWSLKGKTERTPADDLAPKMKICPACNVMNSSENIICHICGYDFTSDEIPTKKRRLPVMVDGELVLLDEHELTERQEEIKIKLSENKKHTKQEEKKTEMKRLSQEEKLQVLKNGLGKKNNMFEAGRKYI